MPDLKDISLYAMMTREEAASWLKGNGWEEVRHNLWIDGQNCCEIDVAILLTEFVNTLHLVPQE